MRRWKRKRYACVCERWIHNENRAWWIDSSAQTTHKRFCNDGNVDRLQPDRIFITWHAHEIDTISTLLFVAFDVEFSGYISVRARIVALIVKMALIACQEKISTIEAADGTPEIQSLVWLSFECGRFHNLIESFYTRWRSLFSSLIFALFISHSKQSFEVLSNATHIFYFCTIRLFSTITNLAALRRIAWFTLQCSC